MGYEETKAFINANIKPNGNNEITGSILNTALNDVLDSGHEEVNQLDQTDNILRYSTISSKYANYPEVDGWVDGSNKFVLGYGTHKVIQVNGGETLKISGVVNIFILKSYTKPSANNLNPDFATGASGRIVINGTYDSVLPEDARFVALNYRLASTQQIETLTELECGGRDYLLGIRPDLMQVIRNYNPVWAYGTISVVDGKWKWFDDPNRVCTVTPIRMKVGDRIELKDYTDARVYIFCKKDDGTIVNSGWITSGSYSCQYDGLYMMTLSNLVEVAQTSIEDLSNLVTITNTDPVAVESFNTASLMASYWNLWKVQNIRLADNLPWEWTPDNTRVSTQFPIRLIKGQTIKLSSYSDASLYIGWRDLDGNYHARNGWITSGEYVVEQDGWYVFNISSVDGTPQTSPIDFAKLLRIGYGVEELEDTIDRMPNITFNPFVNKPFYAHYKVDAFMKDGDGHNIIPNGSLAEIVCAARLGFDYVEIKPKITSDGHYINMHGGANNVFSDNVYALNGDNLQQIQIDSVTLDYIKENVRYNSYSTKYQTTIPTLEEVLVCCKEYNISAFVEAINNDIVNICRQYLDDNSLILYSPLTSVRKDLNFHGMIMHWFNNSTITVQDIIASAKEYGTPFLAGIGWNTISGIGDSGLKELIKALHDNNCLAGFASHGLDLQKYFRFGGDACAADYEVNPFESNYEIYDLNGDASQFILTGTASISNGICSLNNGDRLVCGNTSAILPLGKAQIKIQFSGTLKITFGYLYEVVVSSDGSDVYFDSSFLLQKHTGMRVESVGSTTITEFVYKTSKC